MITIFSFLFLLSLLPSLPFSQALKGVFVDCGATVDTVIGGRKWVADISFITTGTPKNLTVKYQNSPLSTVRTFPFKNNKHKKFCYHIPVYRNGKYLVRTTYYYGEVNEIVNVNPPLFDQIIDGTFWATVNTTEDYMKAMASYYEGIFMASGKSMSVCLAANEYTDSDPFISALELVLLGDSLYNSTDFKNFALSLIARNSFGYNGSTIRYPDDQFDRYWASFGDFNSTASSYRDVSVSGFWNFPPLRVFQTQWTSSWLEPMELLWPRAPLPNSRYYIALYFADDTRSSRMFSILINGMTYYRDLNVTSAGVVVFANQWPLAGFTNITLIPADGSSIGPLINAGEVFDVLPLGGRTLTRDVTAMERLKESFENPPLDWNGDPCLPRKYSWTGVTCSEGPRIRIITLNFRSLGLSGSISPFISELTALSGVWLGNNSLSGSIPDLSSLKRLEILHLQDNQLSGKIPPSLGNITNLRELFLQNNNLTGQIPNNLITKPGLDLRYSPGNPFLSPPQS